MEKKIKLLITLLILMSLVVLSQFFPKSKNNNEEYKNRAITIADTQLHVYVADTDQKKARGLAAFDSIEDDQGMIFEFEDMGIQTFWMKDMKFAIDIIWVRDNKIIAIDKNIQSEQSKSDDEIIRYKSSEDVDTVIETNAGWCDKHNIIIGQIIER